jgi:hypothetical protein
MPVLIPHAERATRVAAKPIVEVCPVKRGNTNTGPLMGYFEEATIPGSPAAFISALRTHGSTRQTAHSAADGMDQRYGSPPYSLEPPARLRRCSRLGAVLTRFRDDIIQSMPPVAARFGAASPTQSCETFPTTSLLLALPAELSKHCAGREAQQSRAPC